MLVNNYKNGKHVEFVSYSGTYPTRCYGVLVLCIDGSNYSFGNSDECQFDKFWESGGCVYWTRDYSNCEITRGEWVINVNDIPNQFQEYAEEIDEVFNYNVPQGCCGGCV